MIQNLLCILMLASALSPQVIFDFNKKSDLKNWRIVDDVVMGGRSAGNFALDKNGHGVFSGDVSLENNGGFSSVRYRFERMSTKGYSKAVIKLKGDGKKYQFRVKHCSSDYYSYIITFPTSGEWEEIVIPLKDMYPSFRGQKLNQANYAHDSIEELAFLISNKKAESFKLLLDKIELK